MEAAYDLLDATEAEADALDKSDEAFAPLEAEATKALRRFQRAVGYGDVMGPVDEEIYAAVASYSSSVENCRIMRSISDEGCSVTELSNKHDEVDRKLKEIAKQASAGK